MLTPFYFLSWTLGSILKINISLGWVYSWNSKIQPQRHYSRSFKISLMKVLQLFKCFPCKVFQWKASPFIMLSTVTGSQICLLNTAKMSLQSLIAHLHIKGSPHSAFIFAKESASSYFISSFFRTTALLFFASIFVEMRNRNKRHIFATL